MLTEDQLERAVYYVALASGIPPKMLRKPRRPHENPACACVPCGRFDSETATYERAMKGETT